MIFYYHPTNPLKVALLLEELAVPYDLVAVDTARGEQQAFRAVNPNGKVPAIIDTDGSDGQEALEDFSGIRRWASEVEVRPAVARVRKVGAAHPFETAFDEETRRALFPTSYPLDVEVLA